MEPSEHLSLLSETIATHAHQMAHRQWENEYRGLLADIFASAKIDVLSVNGSQIPIEVVTRAIRQQFLETRGKELMAKLTNQIVQTAFRKVLDQEEQT